MNKLVEAYYETLGDAPPVYTDPKDAILDLDARCTMLEEQLAILQEQVRQQAVNMLSMAQRLHDFTAPRKSSIVMPDAFN